MNILFDLVTPQEFVGGAGEYIRRVFYELLEYKRTLPDINIFAAYDSSIGKYAYSDLSPTNMSHQTTACIDLAKQNLKSIISQYDIATCFIGAAQYWGARYDLKGVNCRVVCVIHDLVDEECISNEIYAIAIKSPLRALLRSFKSLLWKDRELRRLQPIVDLYKSNEKSEIVVVSEYSLNSLRYYYHLDEKRINVLFSPSRIYNKKEEIENKTLQDIITTGKKFFLLLNAGRPLKNGNKVVRAFDKFVEVTHSSSYLVTTGGLLSDSPNHIKLPYLSDSDLDHLYSNCHALIFPSFFEGFGYPPIEAMKYGKPVLASNCTSIPEICGGAALYFSPMYESDIFRALCVLQKSNYKELSQKSFSNYNDIYKKQEHDLSLLIRKIVST